MRSRLFVLNVLFAVTLASCVNMGPEPYGEDIKAPTLTIAEPVGSEGSLEVTFGASLSGGIAKEDCGFYLSLDETFAASEKVRASSIDKSGKFTYARMLNNYDGKWYCKAYASNGRIEITSSVTSYTVKPFSTYVSATVPDFKSGIDGETVVEFSVTAVWGVSLSECGVCYGTDKSSLSIEHDHISAGSSTGTHTVTITGLKVGQEYFVCSYAREGENVVYSQACSFVVISAPEIKTSSPTQIESSRAVCGGYDIISKGSEITGKGVVWSTFHNPDIETSYSMSAGSGSEPFSCTLSGLKPVTTYYVRAYAKNKVGIGYGEEVTFTTLPIYVSGVELNKTSITITEGDNYTLSASVKPSDATDKNVSWSSSNTGVATVDQSGKVTAVKAGSATITVTTTDGGYTATCSVTVNEPVPEAVDLGLSVKWASFNIGASKPEEYGGYYQWAGLDDVTSTSIYLDWSDCPYHTGSSYNTGWTKYVPSSYSSYWSGSGSPDNKMVLDPSDDVAHVKLGGKWRMPTIDEWIELTNNCIWTWTTQNGVKGYKVTSKKSGYTSKSIFLPAAGYRAHGYLGGLDYLAATDTNLGEYWSSSLSTTSNPSYARNLYFDLDYVHTNFGNGFRCVGLSIRPVCGDRVSVTGVSLSKTSLSLNIGETSTLNATVTPSNAAEKSVSWSSGNTGVATVDKEGKVTAVKEGSATITVKTTDGGYTATCNVTVKKRTEDEDGGNEDYDEEVIEW